MTSLIHRLVFVVFISLYVLSCRTDAPLHFRFDPDTTESEKASTLEAMTDWNEVTLESHQLVLDPKGPWRITFTNDPTVLRSDLDGRTCNLLEDEDRDCADDHWIRVRRGFPQYWEKHIVEHELGHALRVKHIQEGGHVMTPGRNAGLQLTEKDLEGCLKAGACGSIRIYPSLEDVDASDIHSER